MRKIVTSRTFIEMEAGTPNVQSANAFSVIRAAFQVQFTEGYIGSPATEWEGYDFDVTVNDEIVAIKPSLVDRVTGIANSPEEE